MARTSLDRREESGRNHAQRRHTGGRWGRARPVDGDRKVFGTHGLEADEIARREQRRRVRAGIEEPHRGLADQAPPSRRDGGIDARVGAADRNAARGDAGTRARQPLRVKLWRQSGQIGKARREADEGDAVLRRRVPPGEFPRSHARSLGDLREVFRAIRDRNPEETTGGASRSPAAARALDLLPQAREAEPLNVEKDQQGSRARNRVQQTARRGRPEARSQGRRRFVGLLLRRLGVLDEHDAIANLPQQPPHRRLHRRYAGSPASTSA